MSHATLDPSLQGLVAQAASVCGFDPDDVHVLAVSPLTPRDRHDVEAALRGLLGRPCSLPVRELVDLEVRGARCRVALTDRAAEDIERALRRMV